MSLRPEPRRRRGDKTTQSSPRPKPSSPVDNGYSHKKFLIPLLLSVAAASYYVFRAHFSIPEDPLQKSELPKSLVEDLYNQTNWSTLRPQLYFGLRTKHPDSPLFGLLWFQQPREETISQLPIRHWCEHGDDVKFSWTAHDGRTFGREIIEDHDLKLRIDWLANGIRSWNVHISTSSNQSYALVFYMTIQDQNTQLLPRNEHQTTEYLFLDGYSHSLGEFMLNLRLPKAFSRDQISNVAYKISPAMDVRLVTDLIKASLGRRSNLGDLMLTQNEQIPGPSEQEGANFLAVQLTVSGKSSIELELLSEDDDQIDDFEKEFGQKLEEFEQKFDATFPIDYMSESIPSRQLGQIALSNLLGGVGVWHGYSLARTPSVDQLRSYGPLSLLSAVPSRPFFPRGFLWDEGFHNLVIRHFDPQLTLQIFASWLDSLSVDGWIPREMILGVEAQAKVPEEFLVQSPSIANPPMFFFVLEKFLKNSAMFNRHSARIARLYPRIKQFYLWLRETQKGPKPGTMQWQGRNRTTEAELNPKTLPSGLDDLPRASHPSADEYHLDLRCWMAFSSKVLRQLAETFGDSEWVPIVEEDVRLYNNLDSLDTLHWSDKAQQYSDFGFHSLRVQLVKEIRKKRVAQGQKQVDEQIYIRKAMDEPRLRLVDDVYGYVNLFPLLLRLLPADNPKLGILLRSLNQTEHLWTPFGLRSISTKSPYYLARNMEHDPPYWRGPIWININYLALDALLHYANSGGPFSRLSSDLYTQLRQNVIQNVAEQYTRTGFLWENYNDRTGIGMGTRPFTGWTALIVNILAEKFD